MKKRALFLLIALMCFSMLAVIGMQLFWLKNAYEIKKEAFDRQVTAALNEVAQNLEERQMAGFIHQQMDSAGLNYKDILDDNIILSNNYGGKNPHEYSSVKVVRDKNNRQNKITIQVRSDSVNQTNTGNKNNSDIISSNDSTGLHRRIYSNNITVEDISSDSATSPDTTGLNAKTRHFSNVVNKMAVAWVESDVPLEKQYNTDTVRMLITQRLANKNIHTPFRLVLINGKQKDYVFPSPGLNSYASVYSANLIPSSITPSNNKLQVTINNKENILLKSMSLLLSMSGIFTLIILLAFGGSVYFILMQKRMADIRTDLINNMTHELKTPIATIGVATDALRNEFVINNREKFSYYTEIIREENKRMNKQVEQVLQMALLDRKQLAMKEEPIDMHRVIEQSVKNIAPQVELKEGVIRTELEATRYTVKGDLFHLAGVMNNLLDNANKYSPLTPAITITTENSNNYLIISVTDKGIGMGPDALKKIFEKFYRVPTGNIHNQKGFGLGLSYVKTIVAAHKGSIEVTSDFGEGSEFKIHLPLI